MKVTNDIISFDNALEAPDYGDVKYFEEPFAEVTLMVPHFALNDILAICAEKRAEQKSITSIDGKDKYTIKYIMPMSEIITDFFDNIKSMTKGLGSLDYEFKEYR